MGKRYGQITLEERLYLYGFICESISALDHYRLGTLLYVDEKRGKRIKGQQCLQLNVTLPVFSVKLERGPRLPGDSSKA